MTDNNPGHTKTLAEQLRIAEESGTLPDELADEDDSEESDEVVDDVE